jgi:hypothetical protein
MFRKWMLGAVAVAAVGFAAQSASAAPPIVIQPNTGGYRLPPSYSYPRPVPTFPTFPGRPHTHPRHDHDFVVFVQHRGHWDRVGRYETLREAERVERLLERQGRRAKIEIVESRHRPRW